MNTVNILNISMSEEDECSICYNKLYEDENVYMLPECGHCFHTDCIISWFRMKNSEGKCPLCSNKGPNNDNNNIYGWILRFKLISRYINRKEMPLWVKDQYKRYQLAKEKLDAHKKLITEFRKESEYNYNEGEKIMTKMKRKKWTLENNVRREKRMIGSIPVIPLIIPKIKEIKSK